MKTKKISKKLTLNKVNIADLNHNDLNAARGGAQGTYGMICIVGSLAPQQCEETEGTMCTRLRTCYFETYNCPVSVYYVDTGCL
ncbi:MAG: hypothetical protein GY950_08685 [bacterium]|nr:hypothetical protein [bacterium]